MRRSCLVIIGLAAVMGLQEACSTEVAGPGSAPAPPAVADDHLTPPPRCFFSETRASIANTGVKKGPNGNLDCEAIVTLNPALTMNHAAPNGYMGTVTITFDVPVYNFIVDAVGGLICQAAAGQVRLYNGGALVSTTPILNDPQPCNVASIGGHAVPGYIGPVTRVEIDGPEQWSTPGDLGSTVYHSARYVVGYYETPYTPPPKCPPFSDFLLDSTGFRLELEQVLKDILVDPAKTERGGKVWKNRTTGAITFERTVPDSADNCRMFSPLPSSDGERLLLASYHGHGFKQNDITLCKNDYSGAREPVRVNYSTWGGGSKGDWIRARKITEQEQRQVPAYTIDPVNFHRFDPISSDTTLWPTFTSHWTRHPNACVY